MKRIEQRRKWFLVFCIFRFGVLLLCSSLTACTVKTANSDPKIPKVQLERLHGWNAQDTSTYSKCSVCVCDALMHTRAVGLAFSLSICPLPFRKPKLMEIVYSKWPEDKKKWYNLSTDAVWVCTGAHNRAPNWCSRSCLAQLPQLAQLAQLAHCQTTLVFNSEGKKASSC